jgi:hypothetical protein
MTLGSLRPCVRRCARTAPRRKSFSSQTYINPDREVRISGRLPQLAGCTSISADIRADPNRSCDLLVSVRRGTSVAETGYETLVTTSRLISSPSCPPRIRRRRGRGRRVRVALSACAAFSIAAISALIVMRADLAPTASDALPGLDSTDETGPGVEVAHGIGNRPAYVYSVVSGGVYSAAELADAMLQDPLVASHYQGLIAEAVHRESVPRDRPVYVSYRKGGRIYWTRNRVLLRKGETILTDGDTEIRTRCGNAISDTPRTPVAEAEPEPLELDRLVEGTDPAAVDDSLALDGVPLPPDSGQRPVVLSPQTGRLAAGTTPSALANSMFDSPAAGNAMPSGVDGLPSALDSAAGTPALRTNPPSAWFPSPDEESPVPPSPFSDPAPTPVPSGSLGPHSGPHDNPFPEVPGSDVDPEPFGRPPGWEPPADVPPAVDAMDDPIYEGSFSSEPENPVPVPEPGTMLLVGGGSAVALFRRLRSRRT